MNILQRHDPKKHDMKWSPTCSLGLTMAGRLRRRMLAGGLVTRSWPAVME